MNEVEVKIVNDGDNLNPSYETANSSGVDLRAWIPYEDINPNRFIVILPGERRLVKTGLHVAIPEGYEIQVRPRSGLAYKQGVTVLNAPGTIDSDYRGDIGVILINHSNSPFTVTNGERIAQAVLCPVCKIKWDICINKDELSSTNRGEGGFGHTGK